MYNKNMLYNLKHRVKTIEKRYNEIAGAGSLFSEESNSALDELVDEIKKDHIVAKRELESFIDNNLIAIIIETLDRLEKLEGHKCNCSE